MVEVNPITIVRPRCPSDSDRARALQRREQVRLGRKLFSGNWRDLLLDVEKLAQHKYREIRTHAREVKALLIKVNVFRLAAITHADLLLNEAPVVTIPQGNEMQAQRWEEIADHCLFEQRVYDTALTCNIEHLAYVGISRQDGHTCLSVLDSLQCFEVGLTGHDDQPQIVDRRWVITVSKSGEKPRHYLRVERHSAPGGVGQIENFAYQVGHELDCEIPKGAEPVDLKSILGDAAPQPIEFTGVDRPLIFRFANRTLRREPCPDLTKYDVDLIDQLAAVTSQIARIAAKHADPKMRVPEGLVDKKTGTVDAEKIEAFADPLKEAEYLVWDSKMVDVLSLLTNVINWLLMVLEISPSLVGIKAGAAPESYQKLFLEATNTMKRANRIKNSWRPLWERVVTTALRYDAMRLQNYSVEPVSVTLRPGLPRPQEDIINEYGSRLQFGLIDQLSAIEAIEDNKDRAQEIYTRIQADNQRRTEALIGAGFPSTTLSTGDEPGAPDTGDNLDTATGDATA